MTDEDAATAAREWAEQHGHQQLDDRMLAAYGAIIRKKTLKEALDCVPRGNTNIFRWFKDHDLNLSCGPGNIFVAIRADLKTLAE